MGPRRRHTAQQGDALCFIKMNVLWCEKCNLIPEQQQRTLLKPVRDDANSRSVSQLFVKNRVTFQRPATHARNIVYDKYVCIENTLKFLKLVKSCLWL